MNSLDARARAASLAIQDSLAAAAPPAPFATVVRRALVAKFVNVALIGAAAVVFIAAGAAFRSPPPEIPVADTTATTSTTETPTPITTATPVTTVVALPATTDAPQSTTSSAPTSTAPSTSVVTTATTAPTTTTTTTHAPTTTTTTSTTTTTTKPPDTVPPIIEITAPKDRDSFERREIVVRGITEPGATISFRERSATIGDDGKWQFRMLLTSGRNRITVTATDAAGNSAQDSVVVFYVPPDVAEFTAHARFGSCEFDPPYDFYYGTGEPGSKVLIASEFGIGHTTVAKDGTWEVQVFFPEAPYGEAFVVRVTDEFGRSQAFEFVSYAGDAP